MDPRGRWKKENWRLNASWHRRQHTLAHKLSAIGEGYCFVAGKEASNVTLASGGDSLSNLSLSILGRVESRADFVEMHRPA